MEHYEYILKNGKNLKLSHTEAAFLRKKIHEVIQTTSTSKPSPYVKPFTSHSFFGPSLRAIALGVIFVVATGSGITFAAERASPESVLYAIKLTVNEPIARSLQKTLPEKVTFEQKILARRIEEKSLLEKQPHVSETTKDRVTTATKQSLALYNQLIEKGVSQGRLALVEQSLESVETLLLKQVEKTPLTATLAVSNGSTPLTTTDSDTAQVAHLSAFQKGNPYSLESHLDQELSFVKKTRENIRLTKNQTIATTEPSAKKETTSVLTADQNTTNKNTQTQIALTTTNQQNRAPTATASGVLVVHIETPETECLAADCATTSRTASATPTKKFLRITDPTNNTLITQQEITAIAGNIEIVLPKGKYLVSYIDTSKKTLEPQIISIEERKNTTVNFLTQTK